MDEHRFSGLDRKHDAPGSPVEIAEASWRVEVLEPRPEEVPGRIRFQELAGCEDPAQGLRK
jgi:hypothetical protein